MKNSVRSSRGFTLVEIMIVVSIIGLLAAIAIPDFIRARETSQTKSCINNLRQIDSAKQQWALEFRQTGGAAPARTDIEPYLVRGTSGRMPVCPAAGPTADFDTTYTVNEVTNAPACMVVSTAHTLP